MKETELKPCPFCGGIEDMRWVSLLSDGTWALNHYCEKANDELTVTFTVYGNSKKEVIERWNRRADNEQREAD